MASRKMLKEQIRSIYFGLMTDKNLKKYNQMLGKSIEKVGDLLNAQYIGVYIYNDSSGKYQLLVDQGDESIASFYRKDIQENKERFWRRRVSKKHGQNNSSLTYTREVQPFIINMRATIHYKYVRVMVIILTNQNLRTEELQILKEETEGFLNLAHMIWENIDNNEKNEYLYSLSSQLHSPTDKSIVLGRIVNFLKETFPNYTHCLILSHHIEGIDALPIQSIELVDPEVKRASNEAFISGNIQVEHMFNHTYLYAPLSGNQGVYGVIQMIVPTVVQFRETELVFIAEIARTAGKAIESVTLYENSVHMISDLKLINDVTDQLNSNLNFNELIKILKRELIKICQASGIGFIYFHDQSSPTYKVLNESTSYFRTNKGLKFIEFFMKQMDGRRRPILSGDFTRKYPGFPYRSIISVPMIRADFNYGLIIIAHENRSYFTLENFNLMQSLVHHSTLALTNAILKNKLEKTVITDYLTQLYSRGHLDKMLNSHLKKDKQGIFLLFDIDNFKAINDTYGHHVGDRVIVQIANIIRKNISENAFAARWGGEEFAICYPRATLKRVKKQAEKIRKLIREQTNPSVTISCGISTWGTQGADSANEIFIRADKALYQAKASGKNKIIIENELWNFIEM